MITLGHIQRVVFQILSDDIPRFTAATALTTDAKPLALANGMEHQSMMLA